ncbi:iron complex outermembrane receptor protein [Oxalobacteraceae bacterium GrIS 1.11]
MRQQLNKNMRRLGRVAGTLLMSGACQAHASETTLPEILVQDSAETGTRRASVGSKTETDILALPQSISVLERARLEAQQAQSIPQALRYTAGMQVENSGLDPRFDQYLIRGFDSGSGGVFRDGLNLPTRGFAGFTLEPYGLERLEVLRGPSSALYGQTEAGGMVNALSKRPPEERLGELAITYGNFNRKQVAADLGGPLDAKGQWRYRLTMLAREAGGQVDHTSDNRRYLAPALSWQPDADTSLTLLAYLQSDNVPPNFYLPAVGTRQAGPYGRIPVSRFVGEPGVDHFKSDQQSLGYVFEKHLAPAWTVRQNLRYSKVKVDYHSLYVTALQADGRSVERANFQVNQEARVFSADQSLEWRRRFGQAENSLLAGLDVSRSTLDGRQYLGVAPVLDVYAPVYGQALPAAPPSEDRRNVLSQTGFYLQNQLKLSEQYLITAGLRRDLSSVRNDDRLAAQHSGQDDQANTGRIGLTWLAPNGIAPYVSYANSFRPVIGQAADGANFIPERGRQTEVGVKWAPPLRQTLFTAAWFDLRKRNVLAADPEHLGSGAQIQRGEVRVRGLELEIDTELDKNWRMNAAYTGLDATLGGEGGKRPAMVPRSNFSAWIERKLAHGWRAGLGLRRVGARFGDDANTLADPGVNLFDAMLGYRHGAWDVALNVNNLADKIHVANCAGDGTCIYGARRQALLSLRYAW